MACGTSSSSCLDTPDLVCLCEVTTTAQACGASRGAHQRGTPGEGWTSPRSCTRTYRRPACLPSACQREEGTGGMVSPRRTTAHACDHANACCQLCRDGPRVAEHTSPHVVSLSRTLCDHGMLPCHACPFPPCAAVDRSRILAPRCPQQHGLGARSHRGPPRGARLALSAPRRRV